jgi:hypothetical protein
MAENNVVHAFGSVPMSELQKEMLDKIEQFAADVKTGRIVAMGLCGVVNDGSMTSAWMRAEEQFAALVGAVQNLNYRLLSEL